MLVHPVYSRWPSDLSIHPTESFVPTQIREELSLHRSRLVLAGGESTACLTNERLRKSDLQILRESNRQMLIISHHS